MKEKDIGMKLLKRNLFGLGDVDNDIISELSKRLNKDIDTYSPESSIFFTFPYMSLDHLKFRNNFSCCTDKKDYMSVVEIKHDPLNYKSKELSYNISDYRFKVLFINRSRLTSSDTELINKINEHRMLG